MLLAACGGEDQEPLSKAEYEREALALAEGKGSEAAGLFFEIVTGLIPPDECKVKATRFHETLEEIVAEIERLRPPQEVADLQRDFLVTARESVADVGRAVEDVQEGDLSCGFDLNKRIYGLPSTDRAEAIVSEYHELGYLHFFLYGE